MVKTIGIFIGLFSLCVYAEQSAPLTTADAFKHALKQFNPVDVLQGYTNEPAETRLSPTETNDGLKDQGLSAVTQNTTANQVYTQYNTRMKAFQNLNSPEMQIAAQLIEGSAEVKAGGCYTQPPKCTTHTATHTCMDTLIYSQATCQDTLTISVKKIIHTAKRMAISSKVNSLPFDLAHCRPNEMKCTSIDEIHVSPNCQAVSVDVTLNGQKIEASTNQTCHSLMLAIYTTIKSLWTWVDITVTETITEDVWDKKTCQVLQDKVTNGTCIFQSGEPCLDANETKNINGLPVHRACWGRSMAYQCMNGTESSCTSLINQGCKQTLSSCVEQKFGVCTAYSQTFECQNTTCVPQPDICMPSLPCTDGSCDTTNNEESHDLNEGVSRLGALAGVASDVSTNQINEGIAKIFAGSAMDCKSYPLGFRDCCTDSGWGDWVKHCPSDMQALQKAKDDNRVVYLGKYRKHKLDPDEHHAFCIFPSQIGAIIQKEGRLAQLHIPFGKAKSPDCRGITPQELERIHFDKLNLSPIEQELMSRIHVPDLDNASTLNESHIWRLHQEGQAHD